jgi:hypothetical protein
MNIITIYCDETGACVRERNNEDSDAPVDNEEKLYCVAQQCQNDSLHFHS